MRIMQFCRMNEFWRQSRQAMGKQRKKRVWIIFGRPFRICARVLELLEEQPQVHEVQGRTACVFNGAEADNVTFSYGEETILDNVSLEIEKNTVIGITAALLWRKFKQNISPILPSRKCLPHTWTPPSCRIL